MADTPDDGIPYESIYEAPPVLQQPFQQPADERYITLPLPPCYSGLRRAPPSTSQQQGYVTQCQPPLYQTSVVKVEQTSAVRRPTWELQPDMMWARPNLPPGPPPVTSSPSTITMHTDSKQPGDEDEEERKKRMEEADELAAKDVVCCCLGCVFGWIIC